MVRVGFLKKYMVGFLLVGIWFRTNGFQWSFSFSSSLRVKPKSFYKQVRGQARVGVMKGKSFDREKIMLAKKLEEHTEVLADSIMLDLLEFEFKPMVALLALDRVLRRFLVRVMDKSLEAGDYKTPARLLVFQAVTHAVTTADLVDALKPFPEYHEQSLNVLKKAGNGNFYNELKKMYEKVWGEALEGYEDGG